ncbi:branched-chain amino acid ABC transporter ATP-binding protein/permease [Pseudonocardia xishanensis]|uniref:Branched-chain amino acid ABC transporter ATP-binding protein/permease n=1 Tax=Pseudonocardia xishanensis TaxID=630995 RepID=A0ABP8RRK5_9PSEU
MSALVAGVTRRGYLLAALAAVLLLFAPQLGAGPFLVRQIMVAAVFGLVVIGLNLAWGYAGVLALGHVAVFACAAYATGIGAKAGLDGTVTLLVTLLAGFLIGLATSIPGLRLGGWSLAMVSFFLILLIPDLVRILGDVTGGTAGLSGIPQLTLFGTQVADATLYVVVVLAVVVWVALLRNITTSRHGAALLVLKQSPVLAGSLGMSAFRLKVTAVTVGALPAATAGWLFAYLDGFIAPESFGFGLAVTLLAISIVGGSQSFYGAVVAAFLVQVTMLRSSAFDQFALAVNGLVLVLFGILFADGIAGGVARLTAALLRRLPPAPHTGAAVGEVGEVPELPGLPLTVAGVGKTFGGNIALRGVDVRAEPGRVTALIGANGSGKTTLLNCVSGLYVPEQGRITLGATDLTPLGAARIARAGVARTFQTPSIPRRLTVREVVETARFARPYLPMWAAALRLPALRRRGREDRAEADLWLHHVGLSDVADERAESLPLGRRRLLEVARAAAARPSLLLLDEPASGLHEDEVHDLERVLGLLRAAGTTVVLVEHNFPMVLRVADRIHVLELGGLLASGTPHEVSTSERVAESYLGTSTPILAEDPA